MSEVLKPGVTKVKLVDASSLPTPPKKKTGMVMGLEQPPPKRTAPADWPGRIVTVAFGDEVVCTPATNLTIVT